MIEFRQKEFNIKDGFYAGPKDEVPGYFDCLTKGAIVGTAAGAVVGGVNGAIRDDRSAKDDAISGAKIGAGTGALSGLGLKIFLNHLHNPMKEVKYQEVDKGIRKEFGIYNIQGITVGDDVDKRASLDEKFSFNDYNVSSYKINFCIQDNKVTMYTFALNDKELGEIDSILNYYCKKFYGMNYTSTPINQKVNSYSVNITFTNYQAIVSFIMEISGKLETKINLLDNKAGKVQHGEGNRVEGKGAIKFFSSNDNDAALSILGGSSKEILDVFKSRFRSKEAMGFLTMKLLIETIRRSKEKDLALSGKPAPRSAFGNDYLVQTVKRLHYVEGMHFTVKEKDTDSNISLEKGIFIVTVKKGPDSNKLDKDYWKRLQTKVSRSEVSNEVITYTYFMQSKTELDMILNTLFKTGIKFNIFD